MRNLKYLLTPIFPILLILFIAIFTALPTFMNHGNSNLGKADNAWLQMEGDTLYMYDFDRNTFLILDPSDPYNLNGQQTDFSNQVYGYIIKDSYGYFTTDNGIEIINLTGPYPTSISKNPVYFTRSIAINSHYLYCLIGNEIWCVNITESHTLQKITTLNIGAQQDGIHLCVNDEILCYTNRSGLHICDISNPTEIKMISDTSIEFPRYLYLEHDLLYLITDSMKLCIVNLDDPKEPEILCNFIGIWDTYHSIARSDHWNPLSVVVESNVAYIPCNDHGVQILDVSNPKSPSLIGQCHARPGSNAVISGHNLFVVDYDKGILTFNIENPFMINLDLLIFFLILFAAEIILIIIQNIVKKKHKEQEDKDFTTRLEKVTGGGKKLTLAVDDKELLEKFQSLIKVSQKVAIKNAASYLSLTEETFFPKLVEWAKQLPIKIDGEYILIDNIQSFIDTLDSQFMEWNEKEQNKVGKAQ